MTTAISLPTLQSITRRYSRITRRWWLNGGQEDVQELLLAIVLSMAANYFYYVELALKGAAKAARVTAEYAPLVWQIIVAGVYALWAIAETEVPAAYRWVRSQGVPMAVRALDATCRFLLCYEQDSRIETASAALAAVREYQSDWPERMADIADATATEEVIAWARGRWSQLA